MKAFKDIDERFKAKDKRFRSDAQNIDKIRLSKTAYQAYGFINALDEIRSDKEEEGAVSVAPLFAAAEIISLSSLKDEREKDLIMEGYGREHHEDKFIEEPSSGGVSEPDRKSTGRDYEPERKGAGRGSEPERKGAGRGSEPEREGAERESDPERKGDTGLFGKERDGAKRRSFSGKDAGIRDKKEYRKDKGKVERRLAAKTALATGIKNGAVTLGSAEDVLGSYSGDLIKDANKGSVKAVYNTGRDAIRRTGNSIGKKMRRSIGRFFRKIALALGALIAPLIPVILVIVILIMIIAALVVSWNHSKTSEDTDIIAVHDANYTGSDVVAFALQYVGNPYVFGGNSLTDGIDCSHFVYQCLKQTGHYEDEYVMSTYWNQKGVKVDGVNDLRPGDIAVYKGDDGIGHVVIVDERVSGNTFWIVHAKGRDYGIVYEKADIVNYHGVGNLLGFRRF